MNDNRPGLLRMIDRLNDQDINRVVIEYKDRLMRFGFSIFRKFCENSDGVNPIL